MKVGRVLAATTVVVGLIAPASASAAPVVSVTGDDGHPVSLAAGAPAALHTMQVTAAVNVPQADGAGWKWQVTGPDGVTATTIATDSCSSSIRDRDNRVAYKGNGSYTLTVTTYDTTNCSGAVKATSTYGWTVGASVEVVAPAGPLLTRPAGTAVTNTHMIGFRGNPGATYYEVRFAKGGVIGPDGGISGPSTTAIVDSATGAIRFWNFTGPGDYTIVARGQNGDNFTAWSVPVTIKLISPFDLSLVTFPDSRGPSYQLRGTVREKAATGGKVTVSVAKGKKGKTFKTLGKAKVNSQGVFKLRFRLARGTYRVRYSWSGSGAVQRGTVEEVITIRRIIG